MRAAAACLALVALAACSTQPETLPNPYIRVAAAPIRTIGVAAGSSPFAFAVGEALAKRGFKLRTLPERAAVATGAGGPYPPRTALATLSEQGVDAVLSVRLSRAGTGPLESIEELDFLDRAAAAGASVTATADGAVVASADWRPRLGVFFGPTIIRAASGPVAGSDALAPPQEQLADALAAQILR